MGNAREIRRSNTAGSASPSPRSPAPPALPPRPLVDNGSNTTVIETNSPETGSSSTSTNNNNTNNCNPCSKKYVLLCAACGGLAIVLGSLFAVLYVVLRSYTSSLHYFETVPSYVASVSLIITGLLMLSFGWRRNRFGYLVKLCGFCCLVCAVVCVVITVTTTVVHMNRLQTLRECVYNARGRSCTCFTGSSSSSGGQLATTPLGINTPVLVDSPHDLGSAKYIFTDTPDCEVVHGALYACLRALFGLSVIGILVSLFSGMLVYQLLGHERKKMYWEQLELRSRALFRRQHTHPPIPCCGCCQDCRFAPASSSISGSSAAINNPMLAWPPWDVLDDRRYWSLHGGNLYSPGPCADAAGLAGVAGSNGMAPCSGLHQGHGGVTICTAHHHHHHHHRGQQQRSSSSGNNNSSSWNWLPWRPSQAATVSDSSDPSARTRRTERDPAVIIGPDDHYGFPLSGNSNYRPPLALTSSATGTPIGSGIGPERRMIPAPAAAVGWGPPPPYSSRGSSSELGSISASTPMGLSPIRMSPPELAKVHPSGVTSSPSGSVLKKELGGSMRKDQPRQIVNLPPRRKGSGAQQPDPRRMPWSPQTGTGIISHGHSNSFPVAARSLSMIHQTGSPLGRDNVMSGKKLNSETDLYFGDTSSNYTVSAHNDGSNSSAMYEEIHGHRYDKIQRPLAKVTSIRSGGPGKPCQRASWDGQNVAQHQPLRTGSSITATAHPVMTSAGQARSRHSADTAISNKESKMFSPIVVPKYIQQSNSNNWSGSSQQSTDPADTCSFVPYRRAAVVPASGSFNEAGEVYENVTNLDFEEDSKNKQPRTLSPDEEVAILTSQFHGAPPVDESTHENPVSDDDDDDDSIEETMRAVNV